MKKLIIDFKDPAEKSRWELVNDAVMGGISESRLTIEGGIALFQGEVSLENYGGFASIRSLPQDFGLDDYKGLIVRVRGDGKTYRLRLRTDAEYDGIAYQSVFLTEPREWITVQLPFSGFVPVFRGRIVPGAPALSPDRIRRIGFMIADSQEGSFRLELEEVEAYA
ncbi:MAG: CIA30 family protein [Nitrospiraceae bacterium]|nr:MAG: CIA30 family protein [Nitrospiraceae bacterium]